MTILQHTGPCYTQGIASSTPIAEDRTWLSSPHLNKSVNDEKKYWLRKRLNVYQKRSLLVFKPKLLRNLTNFRQWYLVWETNKSVLLASSTLNSCMHEPSRFSSRYLLFSSVSQKSLMSRNACENGEKLPASGDLNWMPIVAPWRLTISAKLAFLAKISRGLAISRMWQIFKLDAKSGPFKLDN